MNCQTPTPKRLYRGKISKTAKHPFDKDYSCGSVTQKNKELTQKVNLLSAILAFSGQQLNKIPFYRRILRPQGR